MPIVTPPTLIQPVGYAWLDDIGTIVAGTTYEATFWWDDPNRVYYDSRYIAQIQFYSAANGGSQLTQTLLDVSYAQGFDLTSGAYSWTPTAGQIAALPAGNDYIISYTALLYNYPTNDGSFGGTPTLHTSSGALYGDVGGTTTTSSSTTTTSSTTTSSTTSSTSSTTSSTTSTTTTAPYYYYFNSVAIIPGTQEDEVWMVRKRTQAGDDDEYFLEQMQPRYVEDLEDQWFVDLGVEYDSTATTTITGLDHLEAEEVAILADGAVHPRQTVTGGQITLNYSASHVIAGLPFRYTLQPTQFDLTVNGSTRGSLKTFAEMVLSFYQSGGVQYGTSTSALRTIDFRTTEAYGSPPALYTGDKVVVHDGGWNTKDTIIITGDDPLPCTLRAIVPRIPEVGR